MFLTEDIARIDSVLANRMITGWLAGDPETITVSPMMTRRRAYVVRFRDEGGSRQWMVDAAGRGIVLRPLGEYRERRARTDVLVAGVMRLLRRRTTPNVLRSELRRLEACAIAEGFDFHMIYEVAATQCAGFSVDLETLMSADPSQQAA